MKAKNLFFVVLLALAPTFSTVSYGQAVLRGLANLLLQKTVEKSNNNNTKTTETATNRTDGSSATNTNEVTLVVSGDGETKDKAINTALRSAIEQAYGTFVSANTTIVNDEMTKDEIVTISNGNIKGYKELSSIMSGGKTAVTLEATVSVSNLITYAQSKGASAEFAGATFARNVKMKELYKQNETKALDNLLTQVKELLPSCYDLEISSVGEPKESENFPNNYELEMVVSFIPNENAQTLSKTFLETLKGLSERLSKKEERNKYPALRLLYAADLNKETKKFISQYTAINSAGYDIAQIYKKGYNPYNFYLRNATDDFMKQLERVTTELEFGFVITDNLGGKSYFTPNFKSVSYELVENGLMKKGGNFYLQRMEGNAFVSMGSSGEYYVNFEKGFSIKVLLVIPQDDISKYSKFDVSLRK